VKLLVQREHDVVCEVRASDALARFERGERFDVVLCDLMMPEMNGIELHARLSALAPDQADAMVFATGGAFTTRAREFVEAVPNAVVEKPFDSAQLLKLIRTRVR
jgi:CheY-like chemotaxis protein